MSHYGFTDYEEGLALLYSPKVAMVKGESVLLSKHNDPYSIETRMSIFGKFKLQGMIYEHFIDVICTHLSLTPDIQYT